MSDKQLPPSGLTSADWDALARYVAGEGSVDERAVMARLLQAQPERGRLLAALEQLVVVHEPAAPSAAEVEAALTMVRARFGEDARIADAPRRAVVVSLDAYRARWRRARLSAAAAVLVVAGAGVLWRSLAGGSPSSAANAPREFATAPGVMDSLTLPDGSRVLLGPGSHLALAPDFGATAREMTLTGEARFSVVHDPAHTFVVHTPSATVRDVGTVFSVHSDANEGARVVVNEGKVEVQGQAGASRQTLGAGDIAIVAPSGTIQLQRAAVGADDLAWTQGRLIFRDASATQVTADLRRWYGVDVRVDSALAMRPVTANFDRGLSGADVAKIVAATIGGALKAEGGVLHIVSLQAGATAP